MVRTKSLAQHLADDFTALQEAVLRRMNGTADAVTLETLADPGLAEPIAVALTHAYTRARGAVRRAELGPGPSDRLRPLRREARRLAAARREAEAVCGRVRGQAHAVLSRPPERLDVRVTRVVLPSVHQDCLRTACANLRLPESVLSVPTGAAGAWAREHGVLTGEVPAPVRELVECDDAVFVAALLRDAREQEDGRLAHDAVVERWHRLASAALAWGRYAIAQAELRALVRPPHARHGTLDALEDAYEDLAVLACRAREAKYLTFRLSCRIRRLASIGDLGAKITAAHVTAYALMADLRPEVISAVQEAVQAHQVGCADRPANCPRCHTALVGTLVLADPPKEAGEEDVPPAVEDTDTASPLPEADDRYALLADLPPGVRVVVADAALGEDSAVCGYGWAAEDGTTGLGISMAASSGEAEIIGICEAALSSLHVDDEAQVVVLCDSKQAVTCLHTALAEGSPDPAHRALLFPESGSLLERLLPHAGRVDVRWLKGHIGHELNETADTLANLALRRATGRIAERTARRAIDDAVRKLPNAPTVTAA
ncbi:RNase H family protein [Streptomyces sp. Wb2n-11]|uniref:RNase H family protein n=1 Tax=Streptomyces sp. Wb2n-11 TaxID=1030533 RepID=UPI000A947F28|nr:RNase H family protein [Streptomyces sp. Wb2n-11]